MRKTARNLKFFCMVILMTILPLTAWNPVLAQNHTETIGKTAKSRSVWRRIFRTHTKDSRRKGQSYPRSQGVSIMGINDAAQLNVKDMPLDKVIAHLLNGQPIRVRYEEWTTGFFLNPTTCLRENDNDEAFFLIEGMVIAEDTKETLIGANIAITDGTQSKTGAAGCITNIDGKFSFACQTRILSSRVWCIRL